MKTKSKKIDLFFILLLALFLLANQSCQTRNFARRFAAPTSSPAGKPRGFLQTNTRGLHLAFGVKPLGGIFGDASLEAAFLHFQKEARKRRSRKFLITNVNTTVLWWVLPPFSFLVTPVFVEVNGYIY